MAVEQISVFVENKQGKLQEVLDVVGGAGVDLRAMSLADTADFGILRIIADDPKNARRLITEAGFVSSITPVLAVAVPDTPGGLASVTRILTEGGISIEYLYVFITHESDTASVIIRADDNEKAAALLEANGVRQLKKEEVYKD